jgi:hypothetical protein
MRRMYEKDGFWLYCRAVPVQQASGDSFKLIGSARFAVGIEEWA